jgi:hypothetical protein
VAWFWTALYNLRLPLLGVHQLKEVLQPFAAEHGLSETDLTGLMDELNRPLLANLPVPAQRAGGRFLMSAVALLWLARKQAQPGGGGGLAWRCADEDADALVEACGSGSVNRHT